MVPAARRATHRNGSIARLDTPIGTWIGDNVTPVRRDDIHGMDDVITSGLYRTGAESMAGLAELVGTAQRSVLGDAFRFSEKSIVRTLEERIATQGVEVDLIHSWYKTRMRSGELSKSRLEPQGVNFHPIRVMQHGKAILVDDRELWVGTAAVGKPTLKRNDIAVRMTGPAAQAYGDLTRATVRADRPAALAAARDAEAAGLLVNDPGADARFLTPALERLVREEPTELQVVSKSLRDRELAALLGTRAGEIPVDVTVRDISMEIEEHLRSAGANVMRVDDPLHTSHANIVAGSDRAYFGSAHLTARALNRDAARSTSREIGVLVDRSTEPAVLDQVRESARLIRADATPADGAHSWQSRAEYWLRTHMGKGFD